MRTYSLLCTECGFPPRKFSYADTAGIAARTHAHEFGHRVVVRWWANYQTHDAVFLPPPAPRAATPQGDLFQGRG